MRGGRRFEGVRKEKKWWEEGEGENGGREGGERGKFCARRAEKGGPRKRGGGGVNGAGLWDGERPTYLSNALIFYSLRNFGIVMYQIATEDKRIQTFHNF